MRAMPSSELAYKALYAALEARPGARGRANDLFVETTGPTTASSYMFIVRSAVTTCGVFAHVDKRCATAPRVDPIAAETCAAFVAALPELALASPPVDEQLTPLPGNATYELRIRNAHVDVTMHFANPRRPDLVALGDAIRALIAEQTAA